MSRPASFRWPFHELDRALIALGYHTRVAKIEALGIPGKHPDRTWWRWRADGIPDEAADQIAINLGTHPALIWTRWHLGPHDPDEFVTAPLREDDLAC